MQFDKTVVTLSTLLFLSLAGNAFMGSMIAGRHFGEGPNKEWQKRDMALREKLSDEDSDILRKTMESSKESFKQARAAREEARRKVHEAMDAEPFDQSAVDRALADEQQKKMALLKLMRQTRQQAMAAMSPEGRAAMAEFNKTMGGGWGMDRRGGKWKRDGGDRREGGGEIKGFPDGEPPRMPPPDGDQGR